jgi:hypothetical protein
MSARFVPEHAMRHSAVILKLPKGSRTRLGLFTAVFFLLVFGLVLGRTLFTEGGREDQAAPGAATGRTQTPEPPSMPPAPESLLENNTVFSVYGRTFGRAPILGRLGSYSNMEAMAVDLPKWVDPIRKHNGGKGVVPAIHLIYAMAVPCEERKECLIYLEGAVRNLVEDVILPAAERGWIVILDTQLGRSNPVAQVRRMIELGYLKHENVHVAIDPEFHVYPSKTTPGVPIGMVEAAQINEVQKLLGEYVRKQGLRTRKILIVHQFGDAHANDGVPFMIQRKKELKAFDDVDLVVDMDGLGTPQFKIWKYNRIGDPAVYPQIRYRGIKVFLPNPWDKAGHVDKPPMTVEQLFGIEPVFGKMRAAFKPDVVIIA